MKATGLSTWKGTWKEGDGTISTTSDTFKEKSYSFSSRFQGTPGASPEELLAAAQAGCFNQALANTFGLIGLEADFIDTSVTVEMEFASKATGHPAILGIALTTNAKVPGIAQGVFEKCAEDARTRCTIAMVLKLDIAMTANLLE